MQNPSSLLILFTISFLLSSCAGRLAVPENSFGEEIAPASPDYGEAKFWSSLPELRDSADLTPPGASRENQEEALADVFFIHPTIFDGGSAWNANLGDTELNEKVDRTTIRHQGSAFNESCRVFAPRYRQMVLGGFYAKTPEDNESKEKALDLAYEDVKQAFQHYLENYNEGRPIVIASHSQGSRHGVKLMQEFFDGTALQDQLVAAYLLGWPIRPSEFKQLPVCEGPTQNACVIGWATWKKNTRFKEDRKKFYEGVIAVNPLTWETDPTFVPASQHQGMLKGDYKTFKRQFSGVEIQNGVLWVKNPVAPLPAKNYHIADVNYFWLDIRANVAERVEAFLE
ncbi:MAG: DUF3089 domain-containing protein [Bacteroidota bacterium]